MMNASVDVLSSADNGTNAALNVTSDSALEGTDATVLGPGVSHAVEEGSELVVLVNLLSWGSVDAYGHKGKQSKGKDEGCLEKTVIKK